MAAKQPKLLYKYYGPDRTDVAESLLVRFSQPGALNDPFEFALNVSPGEVVRAVQKIGRKVANPLTFVGMAFSAAWRSKNNERLASAPAPIRWLIVAILLVVAPILALLLLPFVRRQLVRAMSVAGSGFESVLASKGLGAFLVFSCSELWNSVPMWAHYAANHTGFVIGIDSEIAFENTDSKGKVTKLRPRPVSYVTALPPIRLDRGGTDAIFGSKFKDWSYEREWRFTALADNAAQRGNFASGHEVLLFPLEVAAVKEVIFGLNTSAETIIQVQLAFARSGACPEYFKIAQGEGYQFIRGTSLEVADIPPPQPVPSLIDMFLGPAEQLYADFQSDARAHPIAKKLVD